MSIDSDGLAGVSFVGDALGPLFLEDPVTGSAGGLLAATAALDVSPAVADWPFAADRERLADALGLMAGGLADGVTDDLTWEYRRLFVGPGPMPAPPWGSVYTDREQVVFGESTLVLRAWMMENGVAFTPAERVPEDHIGFMLLLLSWLARNRAGLVEDCLRLHLLTWSSHYLGLLAEAAEHPFYRGLALAADESLLGMQRSFGIDVAYPRFYR